MGRGALCRLGGQTERSDVRPARRFQTAPRDGGRTPRQTPQDQGQSQGERRMTRAMDPRLAAGNRRDMAGVTLQHIGWVVHDAVGVITLNRPERKNPLTFESYAELRDLFRALSSAGDVRAVVVQGAGGNFCSGGDVHEIIGPLTRMQMPQLLEFTRMTGDLIKAMRHCPQPVISSVEGVCAGAGALIALFSDLRYAAPSARVAFLFVRVGLAGCDMGACAMLPRLTGPGRAG